MMTGDLILNLSRTAQSSELITNCDQAKKVDSLGAAAATATGKSSRRSLSKIAQRRGGAQGANELTGSGMGRAPHARYDSSPSSPTNDSTEIDEEIEHDDDARYSGCTCVTSPNYGGEGGVQKCCAAAERCINYYRQQQQHSRDSVDAARAANDRRMGHENNSHSDKTSRLGTMTNNSSTQNNNSSTPTSSSGPRPSTTSTTTQDSRLDGSEEEEQQEESGELQRQRLIGSGHNNNNHNHHHQNNNNNTSKLPQNNHHHHHHRSNGHSSSHANGTSNSGSSSSNGGDTVDRSSSDLMLSEEVCYSVPTSPVTPFAGGLRTSPTANSVPTSPETGGVPGESTAVAAGSAAAAAAAVVMRRHPGSSAASGMMRTCDQAGFRTSRSEDHLQLSQRDGGAGLGMVPIDIDEDVNSSLNTLLDTRDDSPNASSGAQDRIVWTYNAPVKPGQQSAAMYSHSSSMSSSPQHTDTPVSPTSVSSSVMSSNSSSKSLGSANYVAQTNSGGGQHQQGSHHGQQAQYGGGHQQQQQSQSQQNRNTMTDSGTTCPDLSMSEAVSNISSPDYQDDNLLLSSRDLAGGMAVSDPSDSDSTLMVSDTRFADRENRAAYAMRNNGEGVRSAVPQHMLHNQGYSELKDSEDELATLTEDNTPTLMMGGGGGVVGYGERESSPPVSDDGSDVESLHSYHYSPKAVDMPSAIRLAKRLHGLDGFKKSDVSRHLSKK